jgi:hypothetical protein
MVNDYCFEDVIDVLLSYIVILIYRECYWINVDVLVLFENGVLIMKNYVG